MAGPGVCEESHPNKGASLRSIRYGNSIMVFKSRRLTRHLGTAFFTWAIMTGLSAMVCMKSWPNEAVNIWTHPLLAPGCTLYCAGSCYLIFTAWFSWMLGIRFRSDVIAYTRNDLKTVFSNMGVAVACLFVMRLDGHSRTFLAGLDLLVGTLASVGGLTSVLTFFSWKFDFDQQIHPGGKASPQPEESALISLLTGSRLWMIHGITSVFVIIAITWLEVQPQPDIRITPLPKPTPQDVAPFDPGGEPISKGLVNPHTSSC